MNDGLIEKLYQFHLSANYGFQFNGIEKFEKYTIAYHNEIKDYWMNFITDIHVKDKKEFEQIVLDAGSRLKEKDREIVIAILPFMKEVYSNRDIFFDKEYELVSNEVWQIFDNFEYVNNINSKCFFNVTLEKTEDMKQYSEEMIKAYQTGDEEDPYGDLDSLYKEVYANYKKIDNGYKAEFYYIKVNGEIVGVTEGIYDNEIYGIYGIAIRKEFRRKGIGKETIKQQLQMCREKNMKLAFLQTEEGYYPADTYRKLGFKDACIQYYYKKK